MATDVARLSFDPARHYTRSRPAAGSRHPRGGGERAARRSSPRSAGRSCVDIVGPAGTPDDGYAVRAPGTGVDLTVGAGTMYVGGWRVALEAPIRLRDAARLARPSGAATGAARPAGPRARPARAHETDVTAVEDPALYEVALGGPDGAARTRLLQRVQRLPTDGSDCAAALAEDDKRWLQQGLRFDPATRQLASNAGCS